jgi:hypothetical protein
MKASYKLQLEQHQRRLNLSHKQLNKYDREYNNQNLIKYLMSLEPASTGTGFYGTFVITNITGVGSLAKYMQVKLAYNNVDITSYLTIGGGQTKTITIPIGSRLPTSGSTLQEKILLETGVTGVNGDEDITNFTITGATGDIATGFTIDILVDAGSISGGELTQSVTINTEN